MQDWEFRGIDINNLSLYHEDPEEVYFVFRVWFDVDDADCECPIFRSFVDESVHKEGSKVTITEYADGSLLYESTIQRHRVKFKGKIFRCNYHIVEREIVSLRINGHGLHESIHPEDESLGCGDGTLWDARFCGDAKAKKKTFQSPLELPEYWKSIFLHTHRRRFGKRSVNK